MYFFRIYPPDLSRSCELKKVSFSVSANFIPAAVIDDTAFQ